MAKRAPKKLSKQSSAPELGLLVGTTKGVFAFDASSSRRSWKLRGPTLLGQRVFDVCADPRDPRVVLATVSGGHLGPTIHRSTNRGRSWKEVSKPPRFAPAPGGKGKRPTQRGGSRGHAITVNFFLAPGLADESGTWYLGTAPQGLFRSTDGGDTWNEVTGWGHGKHWHAWTGGGLDASPDGAFLHSIQIDPRDARHLFVSLSMGGTFESRDAGASWKPLNAGVAMDFIPGEPLEFGHDPHCMIVHPANPDRLYQQNHCGIYRLDRADGDTWQRIGTKLPKSIGDIGFPIVAHPTDPERVWVFPMDGTESWPRTPKKGKPAVYGTRNGGKRWERFDGGLPEAAWWTVLRQAMCADDRARSTGLYFGTTSGDLWASRDEGETFTNIACHLPRIQSVRFVRWR